MKDANYYQSRINKSLKFLNDHLSQDIKIAELANAAHFSPFHYQRIYKALQHETPYETILRLRLEKSLFLFKYHDHLKISEVVDQAGFGSIENFSRQFKNAFKKTPSEFKTDKSLKDSRIYQDKLKEKIDISKRKSHELSTESFDVQIEVLPQIKVVLKRALFGADGSGLVNAYEELMQWYESNGLSRTASRRFGMSMDDPDVTPSNLYRYDFAVASDRDTNIPDGLELNHLPNGEYATVHCTGDIAKVGQAWDYLYSTWLPKSNYVPRHFPAIEEFNKGPEEIGWDKFDIKCRIPIQKI